MILRQREAGILQRRARALRIQPGRRDEAGGGAAGDVLDQRLAAAHADQRLGMAEAQKLAFARGHVLRLQRGGGAGMGAVVAVRPAVDEHLDALVRPATQARREGWRDRRARPMVRHHQHREAPADMGGEMVEQAVDLALEAGRDVVDRGEQAFHRSRL